MDNYMKVQSYKILMMRAHRKNEIGRDTWGVNAFAAICAREEGNSYIRGSLEKYLTKVRKSLEKGIDKFINRKSVKPEHKLLLAQIKHRLCMVSSSVDIEDVVNTVLNITQPYKEYLTKK
ncbi:hypothetical protein BFP72_06000 [Reichenbachiella sp. 5M10]|uniref:hypothetical protein n=1 Tax=Reichenbachiella sp. 5M10 TaxID=1889772 RepID=UPI000C155E71|nr:hypothetical protein [Reichenbachiella sp. 5M10]PIB34975.1 hypothetical protein BFP72_06000 [Reichenbachiella sp. 5M10]